MVMLVCVYQGVHVQDGLHSCNQQAEADIGFSPATAWNQPANKEVDVMQTSVGTC